MIARSRLSFNFSQEMNLEQNVLVLMFIGSLELFLETDLRCYRLTPASAIVRQTMLRNNITNLKTENTKYALRVGHLRLAVRKAYRYDPLMAL
jgi:hypothetical protein